MVKISKRRTLSLLISLFVLIAAGGCSLPPKPSNDQIRQAIQLFNDTSSDPIDLDYTVMEVPQRFYGQAAAVMWTPNRVIQRNYRIRYDKSRGQFEVESYITLKLDETGTYRQLGESDAD
ncbi:hypothetical protein DSECCO2_518630 [anaerobic digester metagenome]